MKHLFIPYELAVIAKEKGFNEPCFKYYQDEDNELVWLDFNFESNNTSLLDLEGNNVSAPIYQQITDWLKEKHSIVIYTTYFNNNMGEWWDWRIAYTGKFGTETKHNDALNSAIKEAFSLIKPISTTED